MKLTELTDEADFPLIYDMVRSKLEAGQRIMLPSSNAGISFQVAALEPETADPAFDIKLTWHKEIQGAAMHSVNSASYTVAEVKTWKLKKKDSYWALSSS
jgi:hypothetical protein